MAERNVLMLGRELLAVNVHGLNVEDGICLVNADVNGAEKRGKASRGVELLKEDERADEHQQAVGKLHRAAEVKDYRRGTDGNAGELIDDELRQHIEH